MSETISLMMNSPLLMMGSTLIIEAKCELMNDYRKMRSLRSNLKLYRVGGTDDEKATYDSRFQPSDVRLK